MQHTGTVILFPKVPWQNHSRARRVPYGWYSETKPSSEMAHEILCRNQAYRVSSSPGYRKWSHAVRTGDIRYNIPVGGILTKALGARGNTRVWEMLQTPYLLDLKFKLPFEKRWRQSWDDFAVTSRNGTGAVSPPLITIVRNLANGINYRISARTVFLCVRIFYGKLKIISKEFLIKKNW